MTAQVGRMLGALLLLGLSPGCENAATKTCLGTYESAQKLVLGVDPRSASSVSESLEAVESALSACKSASRADEVEQLVKARNELSAQQALLERRASRKRTRVLSPEEQAELARSGDPNCPRGQAYKADPGATLIRCTGPGLTEMTLAQAKAHFQELDYRVSSPSATELRAERGAERYDFSYASEDATAPRCVLIVPAPGLPWQEALARATGTNPERLKNPGTVKTKTGSVPFKVDEENVIIRVGECG